MSGAHRLIIKVNVVVIAFWYLALPIAGKVSLFSFGGTNYDISRIIGLAIVFGNTIILPGVNIRRIPPAVLLFTVLFLGQAVVLIPIGGNFTGSLNVFVRIYSGFLLFFIFCGFHYDKKTNLIEKLLLFMGIYTALYTILQFILYKVSPSFAISLMGQRAFVASYSTVRPQGPLLAAGGSASVITMAFLILLKRLINNHFKNKHWIVAGILSIGLLLNLTRTYLFMLPVITGYCLVYYRRFKSLMVTGVVMTLIVLCSLAVVPPSHYLDRFKDVPGLADANVNNAQLMQGRGLLMDLVWSDLKNKAIHRQLLGDGLYYTNRLLGRHFGVKEASTHNDFLWLLSNMGVIGLVLHLFFYIGAAISYRGNYRVLFIGYLFGVMFVSGLGGETICITGHRFLQVILLAYFFEDRYELNMDRQVSVNLCQHNKVSHP